MTRGEEERESRLEVGSQWAKECQWGLRRNKEEKPRRGDDSRTREKEDMRRI